MDNKEKTPESWESEKEKFVSDFVASELDRLDEAEADGVPFGETEGEGSAEVAFADSDMATVIEQYPMAGEILAMLEKQETGEGEVDGGKVTADGITAFWSKDASPDFGDDDDEDDE